MSSIKDVNNSAIWVKEKRGTIFEQPRGNTIVDERFGPREGLPMVFHDYDKKPFLTLCCHFKNSGSNQENVIQLVKNIENVTKIWLQKLHITGIVGNYNEIVVSFESNSTGSHSSTLSTDTNRILGIERRNNSIVIKGNATPTTNYVFYEPYEHLLIGNYKQPKFLDKVAIRLYDLETNTPIAYNTATLWFETSIEFWQ